MAKSNQTYPTDLNDTEWAQIALLLPGKKKTGRPREHSWREILNGIFYVTKKGCVWRALPYDLPAWQKVYYHFWLFRKNKLWEQMNTNLREAVHMKEGREAQASAMIFDRQTAKSADGGYRGELVTWVKENLGIDMEIVLKIAGQKGFQVLPKRWVIERTNAWISRNRRLARDYERVAESSEAFIYIAMFRLGLRRLARP